MTDANETGLRLLHSPEPAAATELWETCSALAPYGSRIRRLDASGSPDDIEQLLRLADSLLTAQETGR